MGDLSTRLASAYHSQDKVDGLTHLLYRYPARFSPQFVRAALDQFARPGQVVVDPFMGGGTTAVEALARGRRFVGFDINPLSLVIARAKTTPLSLRDAVTLRDWATESSEAHAGVGRGDTRLVNAPRAVVEALAPFVISAAALPRAEQRDAARAVLLHVGQWAIDGRSEPVDATKAVEAIKPTLEGLLSGLTELAEGAREHQLRPSDLPRRRAMFCGATQTVAAARQTNRLVGRASLALTSPPYPGVHVLYHRWQARGGVETPMPYWLAESTDGHGYKHYTMGGRSRIGERAYFSQVELAWSSVRRLLVPGAMVVQLVSFLRPDEQLPKYLLAMEAAGYRHRPDLEPGDWRQVPNRRWYTNVSARPEAAHETLVVHQSVSRDLIP
jgi:hypothetical protein